MTEKKNALQRLEEKYGKLGYCMSDLPEGWHDLVDNLCQELSQIPGWKFDFVAQVKEKFNSLRFYVDLPPKDEQEIALDADKINSLIDASEEEAFRTCPTCGSKDDVRIRQPQNRRLCKGCGEK